jgi:hypothetical protein
MKLTEAVCIGKHLCAFPIQYGLIQGDALSPLLFTFSVEDVIRNIQESEEGLRLSCTHHFVFCANDINLLGESINVVKRNTGALLDPVRKLV